MSKKIVLAILISYIINFLLITGCVSTTRTEAPVYYANTITIPLNSSPQGAGVLLDERERGITPLDLKITYVHSEGDTHESETKYRTLKIEKEGYDPYILSFSIEEKQYKKIPKLIKLKPEAEESVSKTAAPQYFAKTISIPLKSFPQGAKVLLDGRERGITPLDLKITYLHSEGDTHESETKYRILKIEKEGYEPYVLVFSIKDKSHEEIPELIKLKPEAEESVSKTAAPQYFAKTISIPLKSFPQGAKVLLDGRERGITPLDLKITYLHSEGDTHESETKHRILKIEKEGYEPYLSVFSIKDKSHEEIPELIKLKREIAKSVSTGAIIKRLTNSSSGEKVLDLSPDKKWLLVESFDAGNTKSNNFLEKINLSTGQRIIITPQTSNNRQGAWIPDMSGIVFITNRRSSSTLVRSLGIDKEAEVEFITPPYLGSAWFPSVSPDGKNIAFSIMKPDGNFKMSIIKTDGFNFREFGSGRQPNWSPDGKSIVYVKREGDYDQIFKMDSSSGLNITKLSSMDTNDFSPKYSPSGNYIIFISNRTGRSNQLFVMSSNGRGVTQLTDGFFNIGSLIWGKDGYIYFSAKTEGNWDIWRLRPDLR